MNNILWYQPEILSEPDVVILNGIRLNEGCERNTAFEKLNRVADKAIGKKRPWKGYLKGYYFVKGNLNKKDERGRSLSFMFISDDKKGKEQLYKMLGSLEIELSPETEKLVQMYDFKWNNYKTIFWTITLLLLITVLYIIRNKYGK